MPKTAGLHTLAGVLADVPAIYAPQMPASGLGAASRAMAAGIAVGCGVVLITAFCLHPDPAGVGTHAALGLARCQFLYQTGLPCPSCGMTTSFCYLAHGNLAASFFVQPMGTLLALTTAAGFWVAMYMAVSGKPVLRLLRWLPGGYLVVAFVGFAIAAWGWKIFIHLHGMDGWHG